MSLPSLPFLRRVGNAYYFDHGGKPRRWEPLGTDEEAVMRKYRVLLARRGAVTGTVDAMLREHLEALPGTVAPGTLAMYRTWRMHLSGVFGHQRPDEITQADVLQYLENCERTSFRGEISLLSSAYWRWMRQRKLTFNPCAGVKTKRSRSKRTRLLIPVELDAIIAKCGDRVALAVEFAFATGLRISDLCAMRWTDFDGGHVRTRKTGVRQAYERTDDLDDLLARARALQARVASPYVLCNERGQPYTRHSLGRLFRQARKAAGVTDAQFRDVRAAAATERDREEGEAAAQAFLGHTDPRTTRGYLRGRRVNTVRAVQRKSR